MKLSDFKDNKELQDFLKEDKSYYISYGDSDEDTVILELPDEFKNHQAIFASQEYKDFVEKKWKEDDEKRNKEREGLSIFNLSHHSLIMSGTGRSFFGHVEDFLRDYNIKKRKIKIIKLLSNEK